jgi:cytochrome c-type biogenesis protein CcmH/NrfG
MAMQDYCSEKYSNAIQKYEQVLKADPNNLTALKRLAYTYEASGDTARARAVWKKILALNPKNKEVMEKLKLKNKWK